MRIGTGLALKQRNSGGVFSLAAMPFGIDFANAQYRFNSVTYDHAPYESFSGNESSLKYTYNSAGAVFRNATLFNSSIFDTREDIGAINLPDASGGDPGKGFTCTGLAFDGTNYIIGSDGTGKETDNPQVHKCGIVKVSPTGVYVSEIRLDTLYGLGTISSVQGVAIDPTDGSYWAAIDTSGIKHFSTAGVALTGSFTVAGVTVNGLAIDSLRDRIIVGSNSTTAGMIRLDVYARSTQAFVATYNFGRQGVGGNAAVLFNSPDHLYYDAARDYLWITSGSNGPYGNVAAVRGVDYVGVGEADLTTTTAMEGMVLRNDRLICCHDGYFHGWISGALPAINQLQHYDYPRGAKTTAWAMEWDPITRAPRGYVVMQAYTRLNQFATKLDSWTVGGGLAVTANNAVSPGGKTDAEKIQATTGTAIANVYVTGTYAAGNAVESVFLKAGTHRYVWVGDRGSALLSCATFDLQAGTVVGSSGSATALIESAGNGWYRCTLSYATAGGAGSLILAFGQSSHTTDYASQTFAGTENFYAWGGEMGNAPYPLTPQLDNDIFSVARPADTPSVTTAAAGITLPGTLYAKGRTARGTGVQVLAQIDDGTQSNRVRVYRDASRIMHVVVSVAGVDQCDLSLGAVADATDFRIAARIALNDFSASLNGGAVVTDVSGTLPVVTTLRLGNSSAGEQWNSSILLLAWENTARVDSALIAFA